MRPLLAVLSAGLVLLTAAPASAAPVNQAPVAVDDAVTYRNTGGIDYPVAALANDSDPDGDALSYVSVTPASKGNAYLQGGQLFYKPFLGNTGTDSFTYTVSDGQGNTATATVTATLWVDPVAPARPAISSSAPGSMTLTWSAAARAEQYRVYRNGVLVQTTSALTWTDTGLADTSDYTYRLAGVNGGGFEGPLSDAVFRQPRLPTPAGVTVELTNDPTSLLLTWNSGNWLGPWAVYRDGALIASVLSPDFRDFGLVTGREYGYQVQLVGPMPSAPVGISPPSLLSGAVRATPAPLTPIGWLVWNQGGTNGDLGPVTVPERAIPGGRQQDHTRGVVLQQDGATPYPVTGAFAGAYSVAGGVSGDLGFPLDDGQCWPLRDDGCVQFFEGGSIWSSGYTPTRVVRQAIEDGWAATGWEEGPLGYPIGEQVHLPGGVGQEFEGGTVYWSAATGSHGVISDFDDAHWAHGGVGGVLGYPTTDEICGLRADGCYQLFQRGAIYWSPHTGAHVVLGAIAATWGRQGWEGGFLGYPTTDEICGLRNNGCYQLFQGGAVYWSSGTGAHIVFGAIAGTWGRHGWEAGFLGYPTTGEIALARGGGRYQAFQGGTIYWSPTTGAHVVFGAIAGTWGRHGWENGFLGYPTTGEIALARGGGRYQAFQGGSIYWSPATGAHPVAGAIAGTWAAHRWEAGFLGYPTTGEIALTRGGGRYQVFQGGSVYWSPTTGAHAVSGAVRDAWGRQGWEAGRLGYPTSGETISGGVARQNFQGGSIAVELATGRVTYR